MAKTVQKELNLDEVILIPCGLPPHKENSRVWNSNLRLKLTELLVEHEEKLSVSDMEIVREGKSYTAETLKQLRADNPNTKYFFIVGADSLCYMDNWMSPGQIFKNATIVVLGRIGFTSEKVDDYIKFLEEKYKADICKVFMENVDISSSMIREKLEAGEDVSQYTGEEIYKEIKENADAIHSDI